MTCLKPHPMVGLAMWILAAGSYLNVPSRVLCMVDHTRFVRAAGFFIRSASLTGFRGGSMRLGEIIGRVQRGPEPISTVRIISLSDPRQVSSVGFSRESYSIRRWLLKTSRWLPIEASSFLLTLLCVFSSSQGLGYPWYPWPEPLTVTASNIQINHAGVFDGALDPSDGQLQLG